jgi:hypothetical protein
VISEQRRQEIIDTLRRRSVPQRSLDTFAVGLDRFEDALDEDLNRAASGSAVFKAVRGEYGTGKTFFARWLQERAKRAGFAASEVQISEAETGQGVQNVRKVPLRKSCNFKTLKLRIERSSKKNRGFLVGCKNGAFRRP